jgi:hypothetical protein
LDNNRGKLSHFSASSSVVPTQGNKDRGFSPWGVQALQLVAFLKQAPVTPIMANLNDIQEQDQQSSLTGCKINGVIEREATL